MWIGESELMAFDREDLGRDSAYCNGLAADIDNHEPCSWCGEPYDLAMGKDDHYPYCSSRCAHNAEVDSYDSFDLAYVRAIANGWSD